MGHKKTASNLCISGKKKKNIHALYKNKENIYGASAQAKGHPQSIPTANGYFVLSHDTESEHRGLEKSSLTIEVHHVCADTLVL